MDNIFKNIESIRKKKSVKQEVLAEMLGVTQGTYSGYITQNKDIRYSLLLDIANKLGVSVVDIITYPEKYVPEDEGCISCREKDETIRNLNDYINLLTKRR